MLDEMWIAPPQPLGKQGVGAEQSWPTNGDTSFWEVLHALNPLQHLPVIGTIYRAITGDTIPAPMRIFGSIIGGLLTGGPIGMATGIIGNFLEEAWHRSQEPATGAEVAAAPLAQPAAAAAASAYARADQLGMSGAVGTA